MADDTARREALRAGLIEALLNPSDAVVQDLRDSVEVFANCIMPEAAARVALRDLAHVIAREAGVELPGEAAP